MAWASAGVVSKSSVDFLEESGLSPNDAPPIRLVQYLFGFLKFQFADESKGLISLYTVTSIPLCSSLVVFNRISAF